MKNCNQSNILPVKLISGQLSVFQSFKAKHHLRVCSACRKSFEEHKKIWSALTRLASEPNSAPQNALSQASPSIVKLGGFSVKKSYLFAAGALLVLLVAGSLASKALMSFPAEFGVSDKQGRFWNVRSNFEGIIEYKDAKGDLFGKSSNYPGDFLRGKTTLKVAGKNYVFYGPGVHEIVDENGENIGRISLSAFTENQLQKMPKTIVQAAIEAERTGDREDGEPLAGANISGTTYGARGRDGGVGLSWKMYGIAHIDFMSKGGRFRYDCRSLPKTIASILPASLVATPEQLKTPEIDITYNGRRIHAKGYGIYTVKDKNGNIVAMINIAPPANLSHRQTPLLHFVK